MWRGSARATCRLEGGYRTSTSEFIKRSPRRTMLLAVGLVAASLGAVVKPAPAKPEIAKHPFDVVRTTASNFLTIGGFGAAFTGLQTFQKMSGVCGKAKDAVPRFVVQAGLAQGCRWGKVSAGFAGGRAAGQLWRGEDDFQAAMCGAVAGGVAAAPSVREIPSSVVTFVMFSYFIEKLTANGKGGAAKGGAQQLATGRESAQRPAVDYGTRPSGAGPTPGQRLDKLLGVAV